MGFNKNYSNAPEDQILPMDTLELSEVLSGYQYVN